MLSIYERLQVIIETQGINDPLDISREGEIFLYKFLTEEGTLSLYWSSLSDPLKRHQMIPADIYSFGGKLSPDEKWMLVGIDYDGSEKHYLCRLETKTPVTNPKDFDSLTFANVPPHRLMDFAWAPDASFLLYAGAEQNVFSLHKIANDMAASPEPIVTDITGLFWIEWLHQNFACTFGSREPGFKSGLLFVLDPVSKEIISEVPHLMSFQFHPEWHPEKPIIPILQPGEEYGKLALYHADSEEVEAFQQLTGEISTCVWNSQGDTLYLGVIKDGRSKIYSLDTEEKSFKEITVLTGMNFPVQVREVKNSLKLFYIHGDATSRNDLWVHDLTDDSNTRLTIYQSPLLGTDQFPLIPSHSIRWNSSFDQKSIHGFVLVPSSPAPPEGYPCIVVVHGGPMGQYSDEFIGTFQILAQEGFVVFLPNFRGSTGYGEDFLKANFQEAGRADLQDVSSGGEYLVENFSVNPKKLGITGGSYGGYMTLAALAFQPDKWAAGWGNVPIADWEYLYEHGDALFKEFISYMWGDPKKNRDLMRERSPLSKVDNVKAPLGIIQAANDSRTPMPPVFEFAKRLYDRNHSLELHIQPAVGHASIVRGTLVRDTAMMIQFFQRMLLLDQ